MLTDEASVRLRRKAADVIKALNAEGPPSCLVREFHKLEVDGKVKSYDKLISSVAVEDMTPPPVTLDLSPEEIDAIAEDPSNLDLPFLPCHTQAVERLIKDVTATAAAGYSVGATSRHGNRFEQEMSKKLFSRSIMAKCKSKIDFRRHRVPLTVTYSSSGV